MTTDLTKIQEPTETEIAEYAYFLWESEGRIDGRDLDYWLQAKAHLTTARQHEAGLLKPEIKNTPQPLSISTPVPRPTARPTKKRQRATREPAYA